MSTRPLPKLAPAPRSFQHNWVGKYCLKVTAYDAKVSPPKVANVECRLCQKFGRDFGVDDDPTRKRKRTKHVMTWQAPEWRCGNFKSHIKTCHKEEWDAYNQLSVKDKEIFLSVEKEPADFQHQ